ncbi:2-oxoglutarate and iron-dependent oxygenase domain-containing protein [Roseateles toxinivorans]|nr:2-oxoglutarate and iron-dependent oxygenase domain-containing protein [Roseateles toxinivorans]
MATQQLPVINVQALSDPRAGAEALGAVAQQIALACRAHGFFYAVGHAVPQPLIDELERLSRQFFALDETTKLQWRMALGGRAWRAISRPAAS